MRLGILSLVAFFSLQEDTLDRARLLAESGRLAEAVRLLESRTRTEPRAPELAYLAELQAAAGGGPPAGGARPPPPAVGGPSRFGGARPRCRPPSFARRDPFRPRRGGGAHPSGS